MEITLETRRQSNLAIAASNTRCNAALLISFAHGLRPEFRFPNGLFTALWYRPTARYKCAFRYVADITSAGDSEDVNVDSIRFARVSIRFTVVTSVGHLLIRRCILKCTCRITSTYTVFNCN